MPAVIPIIIAATAAASAGATVYAAKKQSETAREGAELQSKAVTESTKIQDKSQAEALAFAKAQAENEYRNQEVARQANYQQWLPREQRMSAFGQTVGLPSRNIPGYMPGVDPNYTGGPMPATIAGVVGQAAPSGSIAAAPTVNPANGDLGAQVAGYFKARGVAPNPTSVGYWVSKWPELTARGVELGDPNYAMKRLAAADEFGGGSAAPATIAAAARPALPYMQPQVSPALQMPTIAGVLR